MPQEIDDEYPCFTARREAEKELKLVALESYYPKELSMDLTQIQAMHESELESLRALVDQHSDGWMNTVRDLQALTADHQSLERCYARALTRIGELEATLTAAQARNTELLEKLRSAR
jgi:hypothetical protein